LVEPLVVRRVLKSRSHLNTVAVEVAYASGNKKREIAAEKCLTGDIALLCAVND